VFKIKILLSVFGGDTLKTQQSVFKRDMFSFKHRYVFFCTVQVFLLKYVLMCVFSPKTYDFLTEKKLAGDFLSMLISTV
jgi:hypothetical protein